MIETILYVGSHPRQNIAGTDAKKKVFAIYKEVKVK
jgi:hypothetical protein